MATHVPDAEAVRIDALTKFKETFGQEATVCVCAPGRVNLIGEHTDYNDGFVLPMALPMVTVVAGSTSYKHDCVVVSFAEGIADEERRVEFSCENRFLVKPGEPKWANYVKGCVANFSCSLRGFKAVIVSTVPMGSGLSSSAALEVASYTFLEALTRCFTTPVEKAQICQRVEHKFAGVPCGIMDQFISVMGVENNALLLDCRDLTTQLIRIGNMDDYVFLVTNSNTPHKLSASAYQDRRQSCIQAAKMMGKASLRDALLADLEVLVKFEASETVIKRARHVITEITRTLEAADALKRGDLIAFGQLMNRSHESLRDDYEVSSPELDSLVSIAREVQGVAGSRLTGAGFGGCTVTLLKKSAVKPVIDRINLKYQGEASFYIAKPSDGAREMGVDLDKC
ncbi:galactokinase-like [Orussus abietinus]|uniref:galactokinase-like n=1 Tax=Orussus abietinus TaxID=222816 RepID=UPI000625BA0A|nr:galactokinase-like [Orussus abietinus]